MKSFIRCCAVLVAMAIATFSSLSASVTSAGNRDILLSKLWGSSDTGFVIQVAPGHRLVLDTPTGGGSYYLAGKRLIIRAGSVFLKDNVSIISWNAADQPKQKKGWDSAAARGADGAGGGGNGSVGMTGHDGASGDPGLDAGQVTLNWGLVDGQGSLTILATGTKGGQGQNGQGGGKGGTAGRGADGSDSCCDCKSSGGDAGDPGDGGPGGAGGMGGTGGKGANVRVSLSVNEHLQKADDPNSNVPPPRPGDVIIAFFGGNGGDPGVGGDGGAGGEGNDGGSGSTYCQGGHGKSKKPQAAKQTKTLGPGLNGASGVVEVLK